MSYTKVIYINHQFRKLSKVFDELSREGYIFIPVIGGPAETCTSSCDFYLDSRVFLAFFLTLWTSVSFAFEEKCSQ